MNTLGDYYPYLRFLRAKPWHVWKTYRDYVVKSEKTRPVEAGKRALDVVDRYLIRRHKTDKLPGSDSCIVELKEKKVVLLKEEFSIADERETCEFDLRASFLPHVFADERVAS